MENEGMWKIGNRLKIKDINGQLWTITIDSIDGNLVNFTDLKGRRRAINKSTNVAEAREMKGSDER